jgi:hypothetical protein
MYLRASSRHAVVDPTTHGACVLWVHLKVLD